MIVRLHAIARWCYLHHIPLVPRLIKIILFVCFNCILPAQVSIGKRTCLHHHGWCILIHPDVEIGDDCNIYNQVVIGGGHDGPDGPPIRIRIGHRVHIGAGAKILCKSGTLTIGDGSTIAANAVVLFDVAPNSLAAGIPAQIRPNRRRSTAA